MSPDRALITRNELRTYKDNMKIRLDSTATFTGDKEAVLPLIKLMYAVYKENEDGYIS